MQEGDTDGRTFSRCYRERTGCREHPLETRASCPAIAVDDLTYVREEAVDHYMDSDLRTDWGHTNGECIMTVLWADKERALKWSEEVRALVEDAEPQYAQRGQDAKHVPHDGTKGGARSHR